MADHSSQQPYYRLPFAYPPQQMQPSAPPEEHRGPSHMQQAPAPDAFASIPGLQHSALPGINLSAYGQNSQQPPFPPRDCLAASTAFRPKCMAAILTAKWHDSSTSHSWLWRPSAFSCPCAPPPFPAHAPLNHATSMAFSPQNPPQPPVAASDRVQGVVGDSEREDGELSDREASQPVARNAYGRARPEPPRSVPQVSRTSPQAEEGYNPDRPADGQTVPQEPARKAPKQASPQNPMDKIQDARDEAKQFIKVLNSNNITYRTLANENLDLELLRGLYQSLNLPSEPAPIVLPKTNGAPPISSTKSPQQASIPAINTDVTPAQATKSVASPTGPVDRKDYIARLQAAKMAKVRGAARASPPQKTPPAQAPTPTPAVKTPQAITTPGAKQPVTDEQRARNTELIRQRLEAIKAKQKPTTTVTNNATASVSRTQKPDLGQATAEHATQPAPSSTSTSNTPTYTPSFPGIPGLFMNAPPSFNSGAPVAPKPLPSVPQKRPAPSETEVSTPRGSVTPYTRPLGQSPHSHHEESMIIQVSDDESNGSDMDIDDDQAAPGPSAASPTSIPNQHQALGKFPNFPSRSGSTIPASSTVSTPGPQTPTTIVREKELEDKEKQLVAMRLTLKKKLAEKREKDKAAAAAAMAISLSGTQDPSTPGLPPQSVSHATPTTDSVQSAPLQLVDASRTAAHDTVDPVRHTKRLRRAEIQSRLPSLDAEIASNTSRMAQLTQEMEQLMAENKRIAIDKEQLTQELENLGIDTEGMSHAELRAKKDEIDHETLPTNTSQGASLGPQPSASDVPNAFIESSKAGSPKLTGTEQIIGSDPLPAQRQISGRLTILPGLGQTAPHLPETEATLPQTPTMDKIIPVPDDTISAQREPQVPASQDVSLSDQLHAPIDIEESTVDATVAPGAHSSATPLDDDEDFYSPAPPAETNPVAEPQTQSESYPGVARSPSEEGEVEMSESEEEEYEPDEPMVITDTHIQEAQAPEPETAQSIATSQVSTEDEEDYEPPDVDQDMSDIQSEAATAEHILDVPPIEVEDGAMDIATSSDESSDDSDSDSESTYEPEVDNTIATNNVPQDNNNTTNNLATASVPEPVSATSNTNSEAAIAAEVEDEPARFTPYESPLRMFKSYRYHPSYAQDVAGGFLSLTYSHQIDPAKRLCQYEAAGGSCNDPECSDQHFRDIGITGEKLLVQLGTANPGKTPDEKQRWNDGLRGVLKELRQKNIKDPNGIAVEIAKYRRQFLDDDTRVVNL
ncbi:uncharacterized protein K460DRAFT_410763 [Cucurbitaria berberidis CBS 394.84]|uniref:Putative zinc-finger domain-containing protein n=1 Tax=Cucurbitaria berberidis CBS 394.84 TaxID=1168544 RepID=A0A9P4G739_9PLEO|nr:uncharacterized protein K460DRAFT_410763 [Cucurbitaria berberidis CBS 394.84]KAF1840162.1 hypothetical protein K460DRAFT_410763 [Cucurbitaria berberidis CBS 394.84]